ncbi:hypothetical protein NC653_002500 [Populus alba x Populus x berolinensis]|uniref:Uncharacterized protein n=1 Tax=Populus alba x Populus x berolinensis TaxID=444605 RepID=A0AAD6RNV7_9ROSI|nr:hypothetical protein NC653_002500 [Populus alba x Populus x berolinensis]
MAVKLRLNFLKHGGSSEEQVSWSQCQPSWWPGWILIAVFLWLKCSRRSLSLLYRIQSSDFRIHSGSLLHFEKQSFDVGIKSLKAVA